MNKKGGIIIPLVTVCAIVLLLVAAFSIFSDKKMPGTEKIGKLQLEIIDLQQEGEGSLFYLDQLVKSSAKKISDDLKNVKFTSNDAFLEAFSKRFSTEFENNVKLAFFDAPFDYKLEYKYENNTIKITGDSRKEIVLPGDYAAYGVEHDFFYEIEYKLNENAKSKQLFEP